MKDITMGESPARASAPRVVDDIGPGISSGGRSRSILIRRLEVSRQTELTIRLPLPVATFVLAGAIGAGLTLGLALASAGITAIANLAKWIAG